MWRRFTYSTVAMYLFPNPHNVVWLVMTQFMCLYVTMIDAVLITTRLRSTMRVFTTYMESTSFVGKLIFFVAVLTLVLDVGRHLVSVCTHAHAHASLFFCLHI